jgi:hypothetical protein
MANLNDLKSFADDVTPIIQDLIKEWVANQQPPGTAAETAAIAKLQKLLAEATQPTVRTRDECADALDALDTALTEIIIQAATNTGVSLPGSKVMIIKEQILAINDALGQLAEVAALAPLATLLPQQDLAQISTDLTAAHAGIQQKQTAQAILDTVVDIVIIASKIAVKVAAA